MLSMLPMSVCGYLCEKKLEVTIGLRARGAANWSTGEIKYTLLDVDRIRADDWSVVAATLQAAHRDVVEGAIVEANDGPASRRRRVGRNRAVWSADGRHRALPVQKRWQESKPT